MTLGVVDDLSINVPRAAKDSEPRPLLGARHPLSDPTLAPRPLI
jgi:hypothetical protein